MASIATAAGRIKAEGAGFVTEALVREACDAARHRWRERVLTPAATLGEEKGSDTIDRGRPGR